MSHFLLDLQAAHQNPIHDLASSSSSEDVGGASSGTLSFVRTLGSLASSIPSPERHSTDSSDGTEIDEYEYEMESSPLSSDISVDSTVAYGH